MPTETQFVPPATNFEEWPEIEPLVQNLLDREIDSPAALERWLLERSDLESYLSETRSHLHVNMTCHTDDEAAQQALRRFNENILPKYTEAQFALNRKYYESEHRAALDPARYGVFDRAVATDIEIYRPANVPLQTELALMRQEHSRITGVQTVEFDGKRRTFPEMSRYYESPDRSVREAAWMTVERRRGQDADAMRRLYDRMLATRHQIARNAGFDNFRDYSFKAMHRFDYGVAECEAFHDTIERLVVPLARRISSERATAMKLDAYRPWDTSVDVRGRGPLDPFDGNVQRMIDGTRRVFERMDGGLAALFQRINSPACLDLDTRNGKAPGGYQTVFAVERRPFIFMNSSGLGRDLRTLLHEAGHAFHTLLGGNDPLIAYRHAPIEFCEVASMSMELTALPWLEEIYRTDDDLSRARRVQLENIIKLLPWIAQIDAFQHWVYTNPDHTHEERETTWSQLNERFGSGVNWSGLEEFEREGWQRQLHLYNYPFYYIEYGIAQIGALQIWLNYRHDPKSAIEQYKAGLALGGSRPLPELFEAAGARFDFGAETVGAVVNAVQDELAALPQ